MIRASLRPPKPAISAATLPFSAMFCARMPSREFLMYTKSLRQRKKNLQMTLQNPQNYFNFMSEQIPSEANKIETDPRKKEGQGLDFWAKALLENGLITQQECDEFIWKNNSKEKMMEKENLPQLKHYGYFDSIEGIREKLTSIKDERFIIRCTSKETGDIKRLVNSSLDEACEFAEKLPGGMDKWKVEMKEFVETVASGTIIVEPSGRATIETWPGAHYLNTTNVKKYQAEFDPDQFHHSYQWKAPEGDEDLPKFQEYAIRALRYIFPHLKPRPNEQIYAEYGIKPSGDVYFIEANDSRLLTGGSREAYED